MDYVCITIVHKINAITSKSILAKLSTLNGKDDLDWHSTFAVPYCFIENQIAEFMKDIKMEIVK